MYFHEDLVPQHFIADHAPAMQSTSIEEWGDVADEHQLFLQCYPHLRFNIRKFKGKISFRKRDELLPVFKDMVQVLYAYPASKDMFILMATSAYYVWKDVWKEAFTAEWFWNEYCADPWGCWSLCLVEIAGHIMSHPCACIHVCHVSPLCA